MKERRPTSNIVERAKLITLIHDPEVLSRTLNLAAGSRNYTEHQQQRGKTGHIEDLVRKSG